MYYFLTFCAGMVAGALVFSVIIRAGFKKLIDNGTIALRTPEGN